MRKPTRPSPPVATLTGRHRKPLLPSVASRLHVKSPNQPRINIGRNIETDLSAANARLRQACVVHADYGLAHAQFNRLSEAERMQMLARELPGVLRLVAGASPIVQRKTPALTLLLALSAVEQLPKLTHLVRYDGKGESVSGLLRAWVAVRSSAGLDWPKGLPVLADVEACGLFVEAQHAPALFLSHAEGVVPGGLIGGRASSTDKPYYFAYRGLSLEGAVAFEFLGREPEHFAAYIPGSFSVADRKIRHRFEDLGRGSPFFEAMLAKVTSVSGSRAAKRLPVEQLAPDAAHARMREICAVLRRPHTNLVLMGVYPA